MDSKLTARRLRELLTYDPATGLFTRNGSAGGRHVSTIAGTINRAGYQKAKLELHPLHWEES